MNTSPCRVNVALLGKYFLTSEAFMLCTTHTDIKRFRRGKIYWEVAEYRLHQKRSNFLNTFTRAVIFSRWLTSRFFIGYIMKWYPYKTDRRRAYLSAKMFHLMPSVYDNHPPPPINLIALITKHFLMPSTQCTNIYKK